MAVNQISVFLENKKGQIFRLTGILADAGINILALSIAESEDYGVVRIIVDKSEKAVELLSASGIIHKVSPITVIAVPDVPGGFADFLSKAVEWSNGFDYVYSLFSTGAGMAYIAVKTDDYVAAESYFSSCGVKIASKSELGIE